jgi:hypothetical protein
LIALAHKVGKSMDMNSDVVVWLGGKEWQKVLD